MTLQPTALVHEAYLKLVGTTKIEWESRAHFFAVAAMAMRQVLADHARRKHAIKRGGELIRVDSVTIAGFQTPTVDADVDLIALDQALAKLSDLDARQCRIVELRFLAGLQTDEVAHVLDISTRTVEREWRAAKAWLRCELSSEDPA